MLLWSLKKEAVCQVVWSEGPASMAEHTAQRLTVTSFGDSDKLGAAGLRRLPWRPAWLSVKCRGDGLGQLATDVATRHRGSKTRTGTKACTGRACSFETDRERATDETLSPSVGQGTSAGTFCAACAFWLRTHVRMKL